MEISRKRILLVFALVLASFVFFMFTAVRLELFPDPRIVERAKTQYTREVKLNPRRGNILDRNGSPLAVSVDLDSVFVDPKMIPDQDRSRLAGQLSEVVGVSQSVILEKMSQPKRFVWIKRLLSFDESEKLKNVIYERNKRGELIRINRGIGVIKEPKRMYPNDNLASHVVGFVNRDAVGMDGVEKSYDEFIKSRDVSVKYGKDRKGRAIYSGSNIFISSDNGNTVYLTIDKNIQYRVERELKRIVDSKNALSGTVVVMDPNNGEILALANYPDYNPNDLSKSNNFAMRNRAVTDAFEPGSIFKIVTAGIALKNKVISLTDKLWGENGKFQLVGGRHPVFVREAKGHDYGFMDLKKLISVSSNVGSAKLGLMIGAKKFYVGIDEFGFGRKTEVDLPGEINGIINRKGGKVEIANMGFGQGISVTAMQMAKSYSIISNGGNSVMPHVVKKIMNEDAEIIYEYPSEPGQKVIADDIAKELSMMLRSVVEEGTGTVTDIRGFDVAGKTGTAQKAAGGKYSPDKYVTSFAGFFPVSSPKYAMLVLIDEPKGAYFAGVVAAPLFRNIANIIIQGTDTVVPVSETSKEEPKHDEVKHKEIYTAVQDRDNVDNIKVEAGEVPDLKGRTLRTALKMIPTGFDDVSVHGQGRVVRQEPAPGTKADSSGSIKIWLE